jgi:hypothetical protein
MVSPKLRSNMVCRKVHISHQAMKMSRNLPIAKGDLAKIEVV